MLYQLSYIGLASLPTCYLQIPRYARDFASRLPLCSRPVYGSTSALSLLECIPSRRRTSVLTANKPRISSVPARSRVSVNVIQANAPRAAYTTNAMARRFKVNTGAQGRIRTSVARKERQIYSLLPLTTRPPVQNCRRLALTHCAATSTELAQTERRNSVKLHRNRSEDSHEHTSARIVTTLWKNSLMECVPGDPAGTAVSPAPAQTSCVTEIISGAGEGI